MLGIFAYIVLNVSAIGGLIAAVHVAAGPIEDKIAMAGIGVTVILVVFALRILELRYLARVEEKWGG